MRSLIKQLAPDRFEDLMALVALYRPGPLSAGMHVEYAERKHQRRPVSYPHPDLEEILAPTYGIMVYQEQVMQIAVRMAGYSMAEADNLRKAMGKKIRAKLMVHREKFVQGCVDNGYPERLGAGPVRPDRAVRRLRVQRVARLRVRLHRVPDRVPEGALPGRVHVGDPDERPRRQGPQAVLPERVPADGARGAPPRRERVRTGLRAGDERRAEDPVRPVRGAQRGFGRGAADHRGAAREGLVHRVRGLLPQGGSLGPDQEGAREPDLRRGVRLVRVPRGGGWSRTRTRSRSRSRPSARPRPPGSSRCSAVASRRPTRSTRA